MPSPRWPLAASACGALAAAAPLRAQSPLLLEVFAARREASGAPLFGGLGLSGYRGPFGLRASGSLNVADRSGAAGAPFGGAACRGPRCRDGGVAVTRAPEGLGLGGWTADADLVVEPLRTAPALRGLLLGFSPYAFGGVGRYTVSPASAADTTLTGLTYGAGVRHQLLGGLGVSAEARFRRAFDRGATAEALRSGTQWRHAQFRAGITASFGGRRAGSGAAPGVAPAAAAVAPPVAAPAERADVPVASPAPAAPAAPRVLDLADGLVSTPYRAGGATPADGFDGAGFVQYVFGREGVALPRTVRELAEAGAAVDPRAGALRPGDLLLFANDGSTPDHVAVYVGRERVVHATASGGGVRYDVLGEGPRGRWFADHLVGARRVLAAPEAAAPVRARPGDAAPPPGVR